MCSIDHTHLFHRLEMIRARVCDDDELRTTKDGVGEERRSEVMIVLD